MDFNEYQKECTKTLINKYDTKVMLLMYLSLGLASESGEYTNKAKKILRDDNAKISEEKKEALLDELGDVLWYASQIASTLDTDFESLAKNNIKKLHSRLERGKISGSGDNR